MRHVKLLSNSEYMQQATAAASTATKQIYVMSLVFADHPKTHLDTASGGCFKLGD
jgi:hypothetical protein